MKMESPQVEISIVAACRNEIGHIAEFLHSILAQDFGALTWEAIIADGSSTDGTREFLDRFCVKHPGIHVTSNPERIVSTGLNRAIQVAQGRYIIRMDAHTSYGQDYCQKCVETLLRTGADNVGGPARTRAEGILPNAIAAAYHSKFSTGGARFHDETYEGWVDTVTYGCWRKETLERLGLFDEELVRNQDDELNLRLVRQGGKIWQSPAITSWYSPRAHLGKLFGQYFQYGYWKVVVIRKHRLPGSWRHLVPAGFVGSIAGLLLASAVLFLVKSKYAVLVSLLLAGMLALYGGATLLASVFTARRTSWKLFPTLPFVFATYHFSYGLGFLLGLSSGLKSSRSRLPKESLFVRVTR